MIIDKFFDSKNNTLALTSSIILLLENENSLSLDFLFEYCNGISTTDISDMLFESLGLLFLTGKITYDSNLDKVVLIK